MRLEIGHNRVPAPPDRIMGMTLVTAEQISCKYFAFYVVQLINHAIGNNHVAAGLEAFKLMCDFLVIESFLI